MKENRRKISFFYLNYSISKTDWIFKNLLISNQEYRSISIYYEYLMDSIMHP